MSDHERLNPDDLLERSIAAVHGEKFSAGPSARTVAGILAVLHEAEKPSNFFNKVVAVVRAHRLAASVALTLSGAAVWLVVISVGSFASVSFAQVAEKLQAIRFMTCTVSVQIPNQGKSVSIREMLMSPGKMRMEMPGGMTTIADAQAGRSLLLEEKTRTATIFEVNKQAAATRPSLQNLDIIGSFKNLAEGKSEPLGDRQISDIKAKGFRVQKGGLNEDIYVDPKTGLPIEVDMDMGQAMGVGPIVIKDFDFDANLDPALFSVDPPAGYTIKTAPKIDLAVDFEQNVVTVLGNYAQHKDGQFPPRLDDSADLLKTIFEAKDGSHNPGGGKLFATVFVTTLRLSQMHKGQDWDYLPEGVRLGDSGKIVFWDQPTGSKMYKAVYGDLRIAEVSANQLPTTRPK